MGISLEGLFQELPFNFEEVKPENFVEPRPGESEDDFISRCVPVLISEGKTQDQALGACYGMYRSGFNHEQLLEDKEMVDGVVDLLLKVDDLENRKRIAKEIIRDFALEGVSYDYDDFLSRIGLVDFGFDFPSGTCWEGYEPYGTKIVDGREVPNCVPVRASKFYDWDTCISDMLDRGYSQSSAEKICGKIRSENMSMLGIYGGAPAYSTEGEADEMAGRLGCKGTHYEEGAGYMPCETHDEAADLYDSSLLLFELKDILAEYLSNENKQ